MAMARKASSSARGTTETLTADLADLVRTFRSLLDPYRPELHYMRGPGPRWHAKHNPAPAAAGALALVNLTHAKV